MDGADLLEQVREKFTRYTVQSSRHAYIALTLYCAYTHAARAFDYAPRLLLTSAEKRSGKTRTLEIIVNLGRHPLVAANATVAAIFRSIDPESPRVLIFDEADTIFGTQFKAELNEDLRGLINAGFQKGTPVLRTVGPTHTPTEFSTFSPVVMAAIGTLPDTITDRAVNLRLRRRKASEQVSQFRSSRNSPELLALRDDVAAWVEENMEELQAAQPDTPLEDRAADLWEPLLAIADVAGGEWPTVARAAAKALVAEAAEADDDHSINLELLRDIRQVTEHHRGDFIQSNALLTLLTSMEDSRWKEDALTGRRVSDLLKPYGIAPRRAPSGNGRGYVLAKFTDAFERYLSTPTTEATDATETAGSSGSGTVTSKPSVTSKRQTETSDSAANGSNSTIQSHLSDLSPPQTGEALFCPCGKELSAYYIRQDRSACPGHEHLQKEVS